MSGRIVVLDTETTGLNRRRNGSSVCVGHRVIEIACVEIVGGKLTDRSFHVYVDPCQSVDDGASRIHGVTDGFLRGRPLFGDIVRDFLDFIHGSVIVIHNAPFDIAFIDQEFALLPLDQQPSGGVFTYVDTLQLARGLFAGTRNDLDSLCRRFDVEGRDGRSHGALLDARLLAEVYLKMLPLL